MFSIPKFEFDKFKIDGNIADYISAEFAVQNKIAPLQKEDEKIYIAMVDPTDLLLINDLENITNSKVFPLQATNEEIKKLHDKIYPGDTKKEEILEELSTDLPAPTNQISELQTVIQKAPIVKLGNMIISRAVKLKASDIHLEPQSNDLRVRYRIDGVLKTEMMLPNSAQMALISRFKIIADLDITEQRIPQDGRIEEEIAGTRIDMRISTLPTIFGEKVVIRILNKNRELLDLKKIGFSRINYKNYTRLISSNYGIILLTGPTGSGKTTTLFSSLNKLNSEEKNIVTIENPVEYRIDGINQVQAKNKIGLTFARTLRSILRQDPDILMVGEIRDKETARIAVRAALTGHLVFSTLHTNDAVSSISRLLDMGVPSYMVASSLIGVVAQRLVRKICAECKTDQVIPAHEAGFFPEKKDYKLFYGKKCENCNNTGYQGRTALHEILVVDNKIKKMITEKRAIEEIKQYALQKDMITLKEDGINKALKGLTSYDELIRVLQ